MKKTLLLLLFFTALANAQIVNIPDANFKAKLLAASPTVHVGSTVNPNSSDNPGVYTAIDTNADGEIQESEAALIVFLNVSNSSISNLQGLEAFVNLKWLYCGYNNLVSLDLSNFTALKFVSCFENNLTSLNVNGCTDLETISAYENALTSLDFSGAENITSLYLKGNNLTSLNVDNLEGLWIVEAPFNDLTTFSLSDKPFLVKLNLGYNQLTTVTLVDLPHLYNVNLQNNLLASVDLSTCAYEPNLNNTPNSSVFDIYLNNNPNLTHINLKNGFLNPELELGASGLDNQVQYVCKDENEVFNYLWLNDNSFVSSYCNYTPGGYYNTISGNMLFDADNNGCDANDVANPFFKVIINDGLEEGASFSNNEGDYVFFTEAGSFDIAPELEDPTFFTITPANATISFADDNYNIATQDFCITANGVHPDVEIVIAPTVPARPGFDAEYKIVYKNKGNQVLSGGLVFVYNDAVLDLVSSSPVQDNALTGILEYNYTDLLPFENREILVTLNVNGPMETPAVNIDDILNFTASVNPIVADETPADNIFVLDQTVVGSFDPNDKQCVEGDIVDPSAIGEYLHYIIRFENTGTYEAENIVVKDVIDTEKFDISTLKVMNSSHAVEARVDDEAAEFIFKNIDLESNGHGNILLKIKTKEHLVEGDSVSNKADIFFDYNYPITTNYAITSFQSALGIDEHLVDNGISVYPNPVHDIINVESLGNLKSVDLYDIQGRLLQTHLAEGLKMSVDISSREQGIYFLKIKSEIGIKVEKIIKR